MPTNFTIDNDTFQLGVPFVKINAKNRTVSGFATLDNVDQAGEVLDTSATKRAFSKWIGNIREMHQKKAVGKAIDMREKQYEDPQSGETYDGMWITAKISKGAEDTWQKVLDGTLAGFSVGGAIFEKERSIRKSADGQDREVWIVKDYALNEVSLVDNPCNQLATVALVKSLDGVIEFEDTLEDGDLEKDATATPDEDESTDINGVDAEAAAALDALKAWRLKEISEEDDEMVACISRLISCLKDYASMDGMMDDYADDPEASDTMKSFDAIKDAIEDLEKRTFSRKQRRAAASTGAAMPDGSFPIENEGDLKNAVQAAGRATNYQAAKAHITTRARALGMESMLPADWMKKDLESEGKTMEKNEDLLQNKEISDKSETITLTSEEKSLFQKLFEKFVGEKPAASEEVVAKEGDVTSDMNKEEVEGLVKGSLEEVSTSFDDKFTQIGEALTKVSETLESVAKSADIETLKTDLESKIEELEGRLATVEESGGMKKSAEETGVEKLEKSDKGLWADSIVPEFLRKQVS